MGQSYFSPAAERNARPILEVLRKELPPRGRVLEIGSGTGQHAVAFGTHMPGLTWQPSDLQHNLAGIRARLEEAKAGNVRMPVKLDVMTAEMAGRRYAAVYSANTAHIMSRSAVRRMFAVAGAVLESGGVFCLYGPFRDHGTFNAESNVAFDRSLRAQDSSMGLRDLEDLEVFATEAGIRLERRFAMPANNELLVWRKRGAGPGEIQQ